jgi:signal transduction histidine kinase
VLAFVLLLFPTGRLRSRRWRPAAWFAGVAFTLTAVDLLVNATRFWSHPFSSSAGETNPPALAAMVIVMGAALVVSVTALVVRFARSSGDERLQLKWFAAAALLVVATTIPAFLTFSVVAIVLSNLAFLCLYAAMGVAVLKYRLYDIDIVISKAVLYATLAVFITAVYAGLVVGVGALAGGRDRPLLSALAAGAERVVVWLRVAGELRPEAASDGRLDAGPLPVDGQALPSLPGAGVAVPVVRQGDLLGAISARMPRGEPLGPAGQQLVSDVASQAGLVLSNAALIGDLRASRQRLVAAQDQERRRLERNIHDGAQQDLVALAIKLRLAGAAVDEDPAQAKEIIGEVQADAVGALENLRDLARGIYPPLLADLGLATALSAQARKSPLPVVVEADGIGRLAQDAEAAVYFCCLEALQNIAKYAHASQVRTGLRAQNGALSVTVSDDGTGYDPRRTPMGSGQRNMADRLAALDGQLEIRSALGQGTIITAHLPLPSASAVAERAGQAGG